LPEGAPKLTPTDPAKKALVDKWVNSGSMVISEVLGTDNPWSGIEKRMGNLLIIITMPMFAAMSAQFR
jgi:hypothetical protein